MVVLASFYPTLAAGQFHVSESFRAGGEGGAPPPAVVRENLEWRAAEPIASDCGDDQ
jgi:hypothetical protein